MEHTVPPIKKQSPSIEALARAVAQSPDGIAVLALDGEFLFANPAWVEMHGYCAEEIIGRRIQELYPDAETARQAEEVMRQLASQDSYQVDINHAKRDGTPFQAWLSVTMLRDGAGTPNGLVLTARDTTKWNRLKAALESEKARLEHQYRRQEAMASIELAINEPNELSIVLERIVTAATRLLPASGGISILLWDAGSQTYSVSASSVLGQPAALAQQRIRQRGGATRWIIEHKESVVVNDIRDNKFDTNPLLTEYGLQAYAGVPIVYDGLCLGVLYALEKEPRTYSANDIDFLTTMAARAGAAISKVRLYEQLRMTNALLHNQATDLAVRNTDLNSFAHTVAHDLKNPLTTIIGFTELLLDEYATLSDAERLEFLGHIAQRGIKMRQIIDELLLMAELHSREVQPTPVDMQKIVAEACSRMQEIQRKHQATLHLPKQWPSAMGYPQWLEEVWANYISNAIKYGGKPPEVWLGATEDTNGTIRFWVKDNGVGLSTEEQKHLFVPFTRLHSDNQEGHGLGLSIVRQIVEKCKGTVGVESAPGAGSTFWFTLPTAKK